MKKHTFKSYIVNTLLGVAIGLPIVLVGVKAQRDSRKDDTVRPYIHTVQETKVETETETEIVKLDIVTEVVTEAPTEPVKVYLGTFNITAYCACDKCCNEWADGITATGTVATQGRTIAVDPNVIPLGSVIEIDGIRYIAEDIGGSIKGNRLDIFFNSHEDALEYGVQYHEVFLIEEASNG